MGDFFNNNNNFVNNNDFFNNDWKKNSDNLFDNNWDQHHKEFEDSFAISHKVFFVFFAIVATFIGCMFIFVIFTICFKLCKGQSFREYQRQRFHTIVTPPPPLSNQCNYF